MFTLFNRSHVRYPTIRQALVQAGLSAAADPAKITLIETHGQYSGRGVTFFRAVDSMHPELQLAAGHVEHNGMVVVTHAPEPEGATPSRQPANRADHADYDRFVSSAQDEETS